MIELLNYKFDDIDGMEGHQFEHFCANLLKENGFSDVRVTPGSGDQGVDILAVKDSIKYAIQCKNYSTPLGNKSIQEVYSGKIFYNCHVGVVMTNSFFTNSALELADKTGVLLWDRNKLTALIKNVNSSRFVEQNHDQSKKLKQQENPKENIYLQAQNILKESDDINELKEAITLFQSVLSWKNSEEQIKKCTNKINQIEGQKQKEKANEKCYSQAQNILKASDDINELKEAIILFQSILSWKDSSEKVGEVQNKIVQLENKYDEIYLNAINILHNTNSIMQFKKALSMFESIRNWKDSEEQIRKCKVKIKSFDFDIENRDDGYYITRFNGFEKIKMIVPSVFDGNPIKGIAKGAFKGCTSIETIHISEGIEIIENAAFQNCKALYSVDLPNTLKTIGSSNAEVAEGAFADTNLRSIVIPQSVNYIGPYTFYFCSHLRSVKMSDQITIIPHDTFVYCKELSSIELPQNLKIIERSAFSECKKLKIVHIPIGTTKICKQAFKDSELDAVYIPPSVIDIEDSNSYVLDKTFGAWTYKEQLVIYCAAGSVAMEYARKHGIKCKEAYFTNNEEQIKPNVCNTNVVEMSPSAERLVKCLETEYTTLMSEHAQLKGFLSFVRKKQIEKRLREIENKLNSTRIS